ncbi:hypothetical protein K491DRAFT_715581 [Lophiostoma macrostomum CBS 122681]|uniref:Zn(2)-C6 fungal-type domain-containing protein n=1 Tax=Lophiostoma macrostomum CBS 122681 TaxID=1314788 RepID=A0A6A6T876_9PLEO|nr:hypothetical protein K491DRAFT_715581 [Lophiostoma macrostomum CBS 122681]
MKAKHNCWTCKERKVGCDRLLPACENCKRSSRRCQGYDIKLAWPDKIDGRRKQKKYQAVPEGSSTDYITQEGHFSFLNTTFDDFSGRKFKIEEVVVTESATRTKFNIPPSITSIRLGDQEGLLLSYYDAIIARMITTIDDGTNGFRLDVIPMALSSSDAASRSLLQSTLALSSFHLGRPEAALRHKVEAIKALSESFSETPHSRLTQIAACMMLTVYSVFDVSDTTWQLHLRGAKTVTEALTSHERRMPSIGFILDWFEYHNTFSGYSHSTDPSQCNHAHNLVLPESNSDSQKIIGLLGCSGELLQLIQCINHLRNLQSCTLPRGRQEQDDILHATQLLRNRLTNLRQECHIVQIESAGAIDSQRITLTAELYRIASLLYLYQVAPLPALPDNAVQSVVMTGFAVLGQLEVCTSPWPLFMLGVHATSDVDRQITLATIDTAVLKRGVGNYQIIKGLIQSVWKQRDLHADDKISTRIDWRELIDPHSGIPSFI